MNRLIILLFLILQFAAAQTDRKRMAVTMDDLPLSIAVKVDNAELDRVTTLLLKQIKDARTPVTAFVNENKLEVKGKRDPQRVATLKRWLDAGSTLGNHTYAHKSQNRVPVQEAKEDIVKGMRTIHQLYAERGGRPEWFRHPYLQTGRDSLTRTVLTAFLDSLGYRTAPVTLDNADWLFASAYDKAFAANDSDGMRAVAAEYLPYIMAKARYYAWMSDTLYKRQIPQILLLHANRLNGDHYAALCAEFRKEGYTFISLDEAMNDAVYRQHDTFFGAGGISWLERWALTNGVTRDFFAQEVPVPMSIKERAGIYDE